MALSSFSMTRRTVAIVVAVVLAIIATIALTQYVQGERNEAIRQNDPVQAYVAKETIPAGMSAEQAIDQGLIVQQPVPRRAVPSGAIDSLEDIQGRVALAPINAGEEIVLSRFAAPGQAGTSLQIPEGFHAISIDVGLVPSAAGFIKPGDNVGVLLNVEETGTESDGAQQASSHTEFLLQRVKVLAMGQRTTTTTNEQGQEQQQTSTVATLALRPEDAERLAHAQFIGQLYLTLMPADAGITDTDGAEGLLDLFGGNLDAAPDEAGSGGEGGGGSA